jgi:hypothetical protein
MAHKKGTGSTRNGRDSNSKRLGVKAYGGEKVTAGTPQGRVLGENPASRGDGKCNRKQTADGLAPLFTGKAETVR